jgi:hypothetical protein
MGSGLISDVPAQPDKTANAINITVNLKPVKPFFEKEYVNVFTTQSKPKF